MTIGERIEQRRKALGIKSQSELARQAGIRQSTLNGLIRNPYRWSPYLTKIARSLNTTVEFLIGETDDPDENAPPPPLPPTIQHLLLPVALPSEAALAAMYEAQLRVFGDLQGAELARALAKRLPSALGRLQAAELYEETVADPAEDKETPPLEQAHPESRRAQRR